MSKRDLHKVLARPDAVNVAYVVDRCRVLGPGERFAVWVQGCPLLCPGCHNPQFLPFQDATWRGIDELAQQIAAVKGIEGVTYVGGEPFAQAKALAALSRRVRESGLSVMAYSGFTLEQLQSSILPSTTELLGEIDLLLDGPYRAEEPTSKPWRGSANQRLVAVSPKFQDVVELWNRPTGQEFEVRFLGDGQIEFLGIPPSNTRNLEHDRIGGGHGQAQ